MRIEGIPVMKQGRGWKVVALVVGVAVMAPAAASAKGGGPKAEDMKLVDACDKASFDATFGPGICQRNAGSVSAAEFSAKLNAKDFGHGAWWINASGGRVGTTKIKQGDSLHVINEGGEAHTFTEVEKYAPGTTSFTGGCIAPLSTPLNLAAFPGDCGAALASTTVQPGRTADVFNLTVGTHHFQCVLHPWMRQTVQVERS
jgi:plastocyanin